MQFMNDLTTSDTKTLSIGNLYFSRAPEVYTCSVDGNVCAKDLIFPHNTFDDKQTHPVYQNHPEQGQSTITIMRSLLCSVGALLRRVDALERALVVERTENLLLIHIGIRPLVLLVSEYLYIGTIII